MNSQINRRALLKSGLCALGLSVLPPQAAQAETGHDGQPVLAGMTALPVDQANPSIQFNINRCEKCGECRKFCASATGVYNPRLPDTDFNCVYCGQCTLICPSGARTEKYDYPQVSLLLNSKDRIKIASIAPSISVSIGEMFGLMPGRDIEGKIVSGLKKIGFDYVLNTCFGADVTVMEEAAELADRIKQGTSGPLFTSCCPSWVRYAELFYPEFKKNISTVKSPFLSQGALVKSWFARKMKIDPEKIDHVAIAPCTAKKYEIRLPYGDSAGVFAKTQKTMRDVDFSLTTRELGQLFKVCGIPRLLTESNAEYDSIMGTASGAGKIFGNSGGVAEAAVRTVYQLLNKKDPPKDLLLWEEIREFKPVRSAVVDLGSVKLKVAVAQGLPAVRQVLEDLKKDPDKYDFVEMMACSGGCIGGGGQPKASSGYDSMYNRRRKGLFKRDAQDEIRCSHHNPEVEALYNDFLAKDESARLLLTHIR